MATVYNIRIKMVSAWTAFPESFVKNILSNFLQTYKAPGSRAGFENVEIIAEEGSGTQHVAVSDVIGCFDHKLIERIRKSTGDAECRRLISQKLTQINS